MVIFLPGKQKIIINYGCDRIEDRESPLSRFGLPGGDDDGKDKGDRNDGDGDGYGKSLSILTYNLSLGVDDVRDPLGGTGQINVLEKNPYVIWIYFQPPEQPRDLGHRIGHRRPIR